MNTEDDWTRRSAVAALLRGGVGSKLAGSTDALVPLQRAYDLARAGHPLHAPWPALTAYRLAHALLASATTPHELLAVQQLFGQACAFGHLGPWPHVYRLAAMHRRGCSTSESSVAFAGVVKAYARWTEQPPDTALNQAPAGTARTDLFNLVDLAGCFIGADRRALGGQGIRHGFEGTDGPHVVLVSGSASRLDVAPVPIARSLAETEFIALRERTPDAVAFRLPLSGEPSWSVLGGETVYGQGVGEMRLLISLMSGDARSPEQLAERATGRHDQAAVTTLRQLRRRLRDRLASAGVAVTAEDLKWRDDSGRFVLHAPVGLLGLVSHNRYYACE